MLDIFKKQFQQVCKYPIQVDYKEVEFNFHPKENTESIFKVITDISNKHDLGYTINYHAMHGLFVEFY